MDDFKTIRFALIICLGCSLVLATAYSVLDPLYKANKKNELRELVLKACGESIYTDKAKTKKKSVTEIEKLFNSKIKFVVLGPNGELADQQDVFKLSESQQFKETNGKKQYYPIYVYTAENGSKKYVTQMSGKGLWSTIKSLVAIDSDLETIAGFEVIGHGETPGLGGEIEKSYFRDPFKGKKLFENGNKLKFEVTKGKAQGNHQVDGLSGATMTCKGVTNLINRDFAIYNKYFAKQRLLKEGK